MGFLRLRTVLMRLAVLALLGSALCVFVRRSGTLNAGVLSLFAILLIGYGPIEPVSYDVLLKGGHVIDAKNKIDAIRDVAIAGGQIAAVAPDIDSRLALKTVDVSDLYVTPGLVDIHMHAYTYTGERGSYADDLGIMPDGFTFRVGVTTVVDAGSSGWRTFEDFKTRIIDRSRSRVLGLLNIVGHGKRGGNYDQDLGDMDAKLTAETVLRHKGKIVGIKTADFTGPEWKPYEQAVQAGRIADVPVMIDFGVARKERPLYDLFSKVLRPGDIFTHMYSGLHGEQDKSGAPSEALYEGRKRGVLFDVGHGRGGFSWNVAIPMMRAGFAPDSISTDLHADSINSGMKDILNVMGKFLAMGIPLAAVILRVTWNPAMEIKREDLGNLSIGSPADVAVMRLENGKFGFVDKEGARLEGTQRLTCELTIRDGKIVYDLNGITREPWQDMPPRNQA